MFRYIRAIKRSFMSTEQIRNEIEEYRQYIEERIENGRIDVVTSNSPDKEIVELAVAFEKMLEHPLAKRNLKIKPKILIDDHDSIIETGGGSVSVPHYIHISREVIENKEAAIATIAHELAHHILGDREPESASKLSRYFSQKKERLADKISVAITGGTTLKSWLSEVDQQSFAAVNFATFMDDFANALSTEEINPNSKPFSDKLPLLVKAALWWGKRQHDYGTREHPSLKSRIHTIEKAGQDLRDNPEWFLESLQNQINAYRGRPVKSR